MNRSPQTRRLALAVAFALGALGGVAGQTLTLTADAPRGCYGVGEPAQLTLTGGAPGAVSLSYGLGPRSAPFRREQVAYDGASLALATTLDHAGFLTVVAEVAGQRAATTLTFGRAEIGALADEPADWDAFWARQRAELATVPLDAQLEALGATAYTTSYRLSLGHVDGRRVYGYVVVPNGPGPFPASLRLPPFGDSPGLMAPDESTAERLGCIAVGISIHDAPPDEVDPDAYTPDDITRPGGYYYRYAVLAAVRAVDYIASRPDWNGRDLLAYGDSQGGGLATLLAGVDARVTLLVQSIAAIAQHAGDSLGRPSGFPYYLTGTRQRFPGDRARYDSVYLASRYYDAALAARRYAGPSLHFVNHEDQVSPPSTVQALHNELGGPRVALHSRRLGHVNPAEFFTARGDFVRRHFPEARTPPWPWPETTLGHYVDAGADAVLRLPDARVMLTGRYGLDERARPDGWPVRWELVGGESRTVSLLDAGAATTEASFADTGTYRLRLRVVDPYPAEPEKYWELTDELTVRVLPDTTVSSTARAPSKALSLSPTLVAPGEPVQVRALGTRPHDLSMPLELRDASGRPVRRYAAGPLPRKLDTAGLPSGAYVVEGPGWQGARLLVR